jgi:hypothetical protein
MAQMVEWLEETQVCIEVRMLNFNVTKVGLKMTLVSCISNAIWCCQVIQVNGQLSFKSGDNDGITTGGGVISKKGSSKNGPQEYKR